MPTEHNMQNINNWLDIIKQFKGFKSDYELAKYWNIDRSIISQYRKGRLRLPIAKCLEIAEIGNYNPLEVILSLEWYRAKESEQEIIKEMYWIATIVNANERMNAYCFSRKYYNRRTKR